MAAETRASDLDRIDTLLASPHQRNVRNALASTRELARAMAEATPLCEHALARLDAAVRDASTTAPASALQALAAVAETYAAFLYKFANQRGVYRLLHRRVVVRATLACHEDLDRVALGLALPPTSTVLTDWRAQWAMLRDAQTRALDAIAHDGAALFGADDDASVPAEALSFLAFELQRTSAAASSDAEVQVLRHALTTTARRTASPLPTVAPWLLPPYELTFEPAPFAFGSTGAVHVGSLGGADVAVTFASTTNSNRFEFARVADAWHCASRAPHVVRLLGACDVGATPYFVAEFAALGPLRRAVADAAVASFTWQLLRDAAAGVAALHGLRMLHNDLRCANIYVLPDATTGSGVTAKLAGFEFATPVDAPTMLLHERVPDVQYTAPEVLATPHMLSTASDVYALGMCIIEAVSQHAPWRDTADATIRQFVTNGTLPSRPLNAFSDDEWLLVTHMCALEPDERVSMAVVLERLTAFATREATQRLARRTDVFDPPLDDVAIGNKSPLRAAELVTAEPFAPLPLSAFDASLRERRADSAAAAAAAAATVSQSQSPATFDPSTSLPLANFEWGAQSQSDARLSPRSLAPPTQSQHRRSSIEKPPSVAPSAVAASQPLPTTLLPGMTTASLPPRSASAEPLVRSASITNARFVTLDGAQQQIVQYEVALQLSTGKDVLVWKRFSAFRNFYRRIRSLHGQKMGAFPAFPSRFPLAGSKSLATVEHRSDALNALLKAVVEDSDVPFGVFVSDRVSLFKAGTDRSDAVLL